MITMQDPATHVANVLNFINLAAEIVNTKPSERYGAIANDCFLLQPGFIPLDPPAVVYIGINPSANNQVNIEEERRLYKELGDRSDIDSYLEAHETWLLENLPKWTVTSSIRKIVAPCGIELEDAALGWLNVCKVPTDNSLALTELHIRRDLPWLKRQLKMMGPSPFIVLGATAVRFSPIRKYLKENYAPGQWVSVGQRDSNADHQRASERLRAWLNVVASG